MLQFAKYLTAAAALALAPAAFAQGHGNGGGGAPHSMGAEHSMGAAHALAAGDNRHDAGTVDRDLDRGHRDLELSAERRDADHRNAHSYGDYRHRGWPQGHHSGWPRHGRHHRPGAMTHAYYSRHDRYRHRHHHVDHRYDHDNR